MRRVKGRTRNELWLSSCSWGLRWKTHTNTHILTQWQLADHYRSVHLRLQVQCIRLNTVSKPTIPPSISTDQSLCTVPWAQTWMWSVCRRHWQWMWSLAACIHRLSVAGRSPDAPHRSAWKHMVPIHWLIFIKQIFDVYIPNIQYMQDKRYS